MEPWVADIFKAVMGGVVALGGAWAVARTQQKAARTEERFGITDRWQKWAEKLEGRVEKAEAEVAELRERVETAESESRSVKAVLALAARWIEAALRILEELGVQHPPVPDEVRRMLLQSPQHEED